MPLPKPYLCKIQNCGRQISAPGYCEDCGAEMAGSPLPPIPWATVLWCLTALCACAGAITFLVIK